MSIHRNRAESGFTLIELLVVMGIMGMLMGLGIGFLQRGSSDMDVALTQVRDQIRAAALTARTKHVPSQVLFDVGDENTPTIVSMRGLMSVGSWHFEEGETWISSIIRPTILGTPEAGRFGLARRPDGKQGPVLGLDFPPHGHFDLSDGFALRIDVRLEQREQMMVLDIGSRLQLWLDQDLVPQVKFVVRSATGTGSGGSKQIKSPDMLPLRRWVTLEVVHDRSRLTLIVDGRQVASTALKGSLMQKDGDRLVVAPAKDPVIGLVDELRLLAYQFSVPASLPLGIEVEAPRVPIEFDRNGDLVAPASFTLILDEDRRTYEVGPGGVVE